ncbi:cob(I)yrinic acid a,c-diamide adenosyltransferase [Tessaracoccus massiliensis]|uniref:cob(I)yrinic acid a,c-diamide adenosyltransferase n=1 Tax=Tessaracoccus massiliensis TaxID=1522311 RepID=UPI00058DE06D|nr:cob(I)yrinic acid a,c-diamide adenosyltransferase [Tessaracoccus massiliensis]
MPAVYTRTGDGGDTGLYGGSRVAKQSLRVEAYGTVDEANAALGEAKAALPDGEWRDRVHALQHRLFVLAAELASDADGARRMADRIDQADITGLERLIDDCLAVTGPQRFFVVPGRDERSAAFHLARTVARRAEREVLRLGEVEEVRPEVIMYLNRLSDAIYALARLTESWADTARIERIVRDAVEQVLAGPTAGLPEDRDLDRAKRIAVAAEAEATRLGVPVVVSVVDAAGHPVLLHRMAGSLLASIDIAQNKAWSSAAFRKTTAELGELAADGGPLPGLADGNAGRVVLFGGGVPLFDGDELVGGLGVSGGTVEEDCIIVQQALQRMGETS